MENEKAKDDLREAEAMMAAWSLDAAFEWEERREGLGVTRGLGVKKGG
jgi:hypothetical protein